MGDLETGLHFSEAAHGWTRVLERPQQYECHSDLCQVRVRWGLDDAWCRCSMGLKAQPFIPVGGFK